MIKSEGSFGGLLMKFKKNQIIIVMS